MTASIHMGAASGLAAGRAMAEYMLEQQIDVAAMRSAAYYGQTAGVEEAIAQSYGAAPQLRTDIDPALADALGLKPGQAIDVDVLANILSGHRADGDELPVQRQHQGKTTYGDVESEDGNVRHRVAYIDLTLSAPKHLSIAWAFAETEAERNSLHQAHRTAVDETLRYIEQQAIRASLGKDCTEPGRMAWVTVEHYTARPTVERVCTDPTTGEVYTALHSTKVTGDMQVHSHCLVPNLIRTDSGRLGAIDAVAFHGRVKEFGAVYQALLARELTKMNVAVDLDPRTNMARLPAIPEQAVDEFSKRSREGEAAARAWAKRQGIDWDELSPERQATIKHLGAHAARQDKETNTPDMQAWREQAKRIGWEHRTVIGTPAAAQRTRVERMDHADREGLPHLAEMLKQRAVLGQGDARVAIARGFIAAGGLDSTDDIGLMAKHWANTSVMQDGRETKLIWKEVEHGKIKITTELHRDQENELIALARSAAADRRLALTSDEVSAAVLRSGVSYTGPRGNSQREAVETVGTDGGLSVVVGVAGSGKSTYILKPAVEGWKHRGLEVWGTAQAWRQAKDLRGAGIEHARTRALDPLLAGIADGRTKVGEDSVVVLDEVGRIGTRQLLELLRLREKHGFKLAMFGDDRQATAIEAGPVVQLLRRALGEERIPMLLETIRQEKTREQEIAGMWRQGEAAEAIAAKRADGTAELVPGGYREAVERVADLYVERRKATADRQDYRISISAPTNFDAHEIARLVRERRREMGEVGPNLAQISVTDGQGNGRNLDLAVGDRVRLFAQTRGIFESETGRRKSAVVGDNGTVLEVLGVDRNNGMRVRGESGKVAFVPWEALRERGGKRPMLAYGDVLTIDTAQGITSHEHIDATPAGSSAVDSGKAYVKGSRHIVRHHLVGSMGAELREAQGRRMSGLPQMTPKEATQAAWANLTRNLSRLVEKDSALAMLEQQAVGKRDSAKALQGALRRHEAREVAGMNATTVREVQAARTVRKAAPTLAEGVEAVAEQQVSVSKVVNAVGSHEAKPSPQPRMVKISEVEAQQQFADALRAHGLRLKGLPIMDGKLYYAPVDGNRSSEKSGAYKGFYGDDRVPAGAIYNYKQGGFVGTWKAHGETVAVSAEELAERAARAAERTEQQRLERIARETSGATKAAAMIAVAWPAPASHPYLAAKGVDPIGLYQDREGNLLVPLRNIDGELRNVQTIEPDGSKMYLYGAQKMGTFHMLGELRPGEPVAIAEGYATAASVHRATGMPVAVALDTSNLSAVAMELRKQDPERPIWMAADNDHHLPLRDPPLANVGLEKAEVAAGLVGGKVLLAPEAPERAAIGKGTDWNDYEVINGRRATEAALRIGMGETAAPQQVQRAVSRQSMGY